MPAPEIENAAAADLEEIASLHMEAWQAAYADILPPSALRSTGLPTFRRQWKAMLQSDTCQTLVRRADGVILGACAVGTCADTDLGDSTRSMEIYSIFVDPKRFRQGIGRQLVEAHLQGATFSRLYAWAVVGAVSEGKFYEGLNFVKEADSEKDVPLKGTPLRAVRYRLDLPDAD